MLLFCDTDCLIQLFIANQSTLLEWFRAEYDLEALIVPEVGSELSWHAKFKDRFDADLRKAVAAGVISVFDYTRPELQLSRLVSVAQAPTVARAIIGLSSLTMSVRHQPPASGTTIRCTS